MITNLNDIFLMFIVNSYYKLPVIESDSKRLKE